MQCKSERGEAARGHVGKLTWGHGERQREACSLFLVRCFLQRSQGRAWLSEPAVEPGEKRMSIEVRVSVRERRVRDNPPYLEAERQDSKGAA